MVTTKEKNFISVVTYIHNAEDKLDKFLNTLTGFLEENFDKYELIFVNSASTDKSVEKIKKFVELNNFSHVINIINMSSYHDLELSMNAGVDLAIGDFVYEFDSLEIDYKKETMLDVYRRSLQGYDIVAAVPDTKPGLMSGTFYNIYNRTKTDGGYDLRRETFRILSRRSINRIKSISKTVPYRKALYMNCGLPYDSVVYSPTQKIKRKYSKIEASSRLDLAMDSLILFTNAVSRITLWISLFFFLFAFGVGIYTVVVYFGNNKPVTGWTPVMGFLSAGFSGVFIILTIVIKYLSLMLNSMFIKQRYLIESIEKVTN